MPLHPFSDRDCIRADQPEALEAACEIANDGQADWWTGASRWACCEFSFPNRSWYTVNDNANGLMMVEHLEPPSTGPRRRKTRIKSGNGVYNSSLRFGNGRRGRREMLCSGEMRWVSRIIEGEILTGDRLNTWSSLIKMKTRG